MKGSNLSRLIRLCAAVFITTSCRPALPQNTPVVPDRARPDYSDVSEPTPLILGVDEGERRIRRWVGPTPLFIIKVDPRNGGSRDLMMGYEDIPPGGAIPPHRHRIADEIIFVHRGAGVVELGDRKEPFATGATIYIPRDVRIAVRNTGSEPLSIVFVFSKPGWEQLSREASVPEGQPVTMLSPAQLTEIRKQHEWHMVFEKP
jgi:quercetin dioxygenase-like cupin family protein